MGKWIKNGCPRCGGSLYIDNDMDGWYEQCINCSFRHELKASGESASRPRSDQAHPKSSSCPER